MDHRFKALIALSLFGALGIAHAGYAQAVPPAGWTTASGGSFNFTAANSPSFSASTVRANALLNVGGRAVQLPASFSFAANSPRLAAQAVAAGGSFLTMPAVAGWLTAAGLAYVAYQWLSTEAPTDSFGENYLYKSDGYYYTDSFGQGRVFYSLTALAAFHVSYLDNLFAEPGRFSYSLQQPYYSVIDSRGGTTSGYGGSNNLSNCPANWYATPAGCVSAAPPLNMSPQEAELRLTETPMPPAVPTEIPRPFPVTQPQIAPTFVPSGDPLPNPRFDPQQPPSPSNPPQIQPGTEVRPAPTANSPWQVNTSPVDKPVVDPSAPPSRDPSPLPEGSGPTGNEPVDPQTKGLCDQYPNILACQTLEQEDDNTELPEKAVEFNFNPIPGFQGTKTCPAFPSVAHILGGREISWQPFCDTLAKISNLLLAFAWASAAFILLGRSD